MMKEYELIKMTMEDMIAYLETKGEDPKTFSSMAEKDIRDHIIDNYEPDCMAIHSENEDEDYSILHPEETVEEFESHEDHFKG